MGTTYIISGVGKLGRESNHFVMKDVEGNCSKILPSKTDQLVLVGNVSISGDALRLLAIKQIPTTFIAKNGRFNSRLDYGLPKNIFARRAQFRLSDNPEKALCIAKDIVRGKIHNQITFIQKKATDQEKEIADNLKDKLHHHLVNIDTVESLESLRGIEGMAARIFYDFIKVHLKPGWAVFHSRSKHPPKTNVNAVLSFLYTVLGSRVRCAVEAQGLDPMVGTLHELAYGRESLVYDLVEEFRTPVADMVCCALFNLGILTESDFRLVDLDTDEETPFVQEVDKQSSGNKAILLMESGMKKVIHRFEEQLAREVTYGVEQNKCSYEEIIYAQVARYKDVILENLPNYRSFMFR